MRWVFCALVLLGLASPAVAADLDVDVLRGPEIAGASALPVGPATFTRWSGFYAGGQFGLSNANADFSNSTQALVAYTLRDTTLENQQAPSQWPVLGIANQSAIGYGAFVGYNTQWQDLVLGMEANFNQASLFSPRAVFADRTHDERQHRQRLRGQFHRQRLDCRPGLRHVAAAGRLGCRAIFCLTVLSVSRWA